MQGASQRVATIDPIFNRVGRLRSDLYAFKERFKSPFAVSCIEVASTFAGIRVSETQSASEVEISVG